MEVSLKSKKLRKCCEDIDEARRKYGDVQARVLIRRIGQLRANETLADVTTIPQVRLHALKQNRKGQFAVHLKHPYRLIFVPDQDQFDMNDWSTIRSIKIIEVDDYH